ncbi:MAG: hypothetical protein K0R03_506 [Moraxellaceae bacterium]|jgi:uncharacterized repeat protein (TIGR01451 family)|nr:hypothetical protein [Moraxellaceae bacterium]
MRARLFAAILMLPLLSGLASAKEKLELNITAEKEVTVTEGSKKVVKRVPADRFAPGEVIIYTLNYKNVGDAKATGVTLDNPLPAGTRYVAESATGVNSQISFTVDGKAYAKAAELSIERTVAGKKEKTRATPADYTGIRWVIAEVKPGQAGQVAFRAQVQ